MHLGGAKGYATCQGEGLCGKEWDHLSRCHRRDKEERSQWPQRIYLILLAAILLVRRSA